MNEFLKLTVKNINDCNVIWCPCMKCKNITLHSLKEIISHIYLNEFDSNYQRWIWHGEYCEFSVGTSSQFESVDIEFGKDDSSIEEDVTYNNIEITCDAFDNLMIFLIILLNFPFCWRMWRNLCT